MIAPNRSDLLEMARVRLQAALDLAMPLDPGTPELDAALALTAEAHECLREASTRPRVPRGPQELRHEARAGSPDPSVGSTPDRNHGASRGLQDDSHDGDESHAQEDMA